MIDKLNEIVNREREKVDMGLEIGKIEYRNQSEKEREKVERAAERQ